MPDVVFSKGGSGALPVVVATWFYRIPIIIHESDASPGLTNLLSRYFASRIATSFESTTQFFDSRKTAWTGAPLRLEFLGKIIAKEAAKEQMGFPPAEPLVLIIGGSQGSLRLNEFIMSVLPLLLKETSVLHQTGRANLREVEELSRPVLAGISVELERRHPYKFAPYFDDNMALAYSAADVVVSRAGGSSIAEIAAFGKPSILVPHDSGSNGHQRINAYEYAKNGAAIIIEEDNFLPGIFIGQLNAILHDEACAKKMQDAALAFHKPEAARTVAEEILKLGFRIKD